MHFIPACLCILCETVSSCHFFVLPQPTFHFYHKGQKTNEIVGADVKKLETAMQSLNKYVFLIPYTRFVVFCFKISCVVSIKAKKPDKLN